MLRHAVPAGLASGAVRALVKDSTASPERDIGILILAPLDAGHGKPGDGEGAPSNGGGAG